VCRKPFTRSGTLTVWATVNGDKVSGAVTVSVKKPQLQLTAVPSVIQSGAAVTFTASISPSGVTWSIQSWQWTPKSGTGGISAACAWNNNPCTRNITKSGTMVVTATVDGETQTASTPVWVSNCVTGDSILDDARIRQQLRQMWDSMNTTGPAQNRTERYGYRYFDSTTFTLRDTTFAPFSGATPCRTWGNGVAPPYLGPRTLIWHGHGFQPRDGTSHNDTLPDNCPPREGAPPRPPNSKRYEAPGPSPDDIEHAAAYGAQYIVVDKRAVYRSWGRPVSRSQCDLLQWQ